MEKYQDPKMLLYHRKPDVRGHDQPYSDSVTWWRSSDVFNQAFRRADRSRRMVTLGVFFSLYPQMSYGQYSGLITINRG